MGTRYLWFRAGSQLLIGLLVVTITMAITDTDNNTIRIGYFMAQDPYRAAAINLAIAQAQDDGMLRQFNFRYNTSVGCCDLSGKVFLSSNDHVPGLYQQAYTKQ